MHICKQYGISNSTENGNDESDGSFKFKQRGNNSLICGFQMDGTDRNNKSLISINENEDVHQPHREDEKISKADEDFKLILKAAGASNSSGISLMFPDEKAVNKNSLEERKLNDSNGRTCSITLDDKEGSQRFEEYLGNSLICGFNKEEANEEETTKENNKREKQHTKRVNNKERVDFPLILDSAGTSDPNIVASVSSRALKVPKDKENSTNRSEHANQFAGLCVKEHYANAHDSDGSLSVSLLDRDTMICDFRSPTNNCSCASLGISTEEMKESSTAQQLISM